LGTGRMPPPKFVCDCFHKNECKFRKGMDFAKHLFKFFQLFLKKN